MSRTTAARTVLSLGAALAVSMPIGATAQQTPRPQQTPRETSPTAATPSPQRPRSVTRPTAARGRAQGFSVVLVLADVLAGSGQGEEVPPAAQKALKDMQEFLPYKSYKLLDASWIMCCGQDARTAAFSERSTMSGHGAGVVSQQLNGPDGRHYELRLSSSGADEARVFVRFSLLGAGSVSEASSEPTAAVMASSARRHADMQDQLSLLDSRIKELKQRVALGVESGSDVAELEAKRRSMAREIAELTQGRAAALQRHETRVTTERALRATVIDTSFTMDVGETVVVGTSRLRDGSKALIALLTAVPPRGSSKAGPGR